MDGISQMDPFSLGADALEQEDYVAACGHFEAYLQTHPQDADAWHNLGLSWFYRHEYSQAKRCWQTARTYTYEPELLEDTLFEAAHDLIHLHRRSLGAIPFLEMLLDSPRYGRKSHLFLIWCLMINDQIQESITQADAALKRYPDDLAFWLQKTFLFPAVYESPKEIAWWRQRFETSLTEFENWLDSAAQFDMTDVLTYSPIFNLMPMGMDEKETFKRISKLWRRLFVDKQADELKHEVSRSGPIRLGMVSASVWNHSTMHYFQGMLELLSLESDFTSALFDFSQREDGMTDYVRQFVHHNVKMTRELEPALEAIRAWQPDILLYLDIGQETLLYTLAHYRLAPFQCVTAGVPITTGVDTIDTYISSQRFELAEAQKYYSEQLVQLNHLMVCMRPPQLPDVLKTRADFGIREEAHVYFFPHTLIRVDPELDDIFAEILIQDPDAELYLIQLLNSDVHLQLQRRFGRRFPELLNRLHFLPWMGQPDFLNLLALADVALDALRLAGGNVSFQAFWTGTPMVTCPTPFLRGRIATGLYQLLGLENWVATDWDDYLQKALKLGREPETRRQLSEQILAGREQIFNRSEGINEIFLLFKSWAGR